MFRNDEGCMLRNDKGCMLRNDKRGGATNHTNKNKLTDEKELLWQDISCANISRLQVQGVKGGLK